MNPALEKLATDLRERSAARVEEQKQTPGYNWHELGREPRNNAEVMFVALVRMYERTGYDWLEALDSAAAQQSYQASHDGSERARAIRAAAIVSALEPPTEPAA